MNMTNEGEALFPFHAISEERLSFLSDMIRNPRITVGEFTYYDGVYNLFEQETVCYLEEDMDDRLIIGKFCSIGAHARFLMNGANHRLYSATTYPFDRFMPFQDVLPTYARHAPSRGDTVVGNDVWIGRQSLIMPGVHIGDGAVIGAGAVVTRDVEPYAIMAGTPARLIRKRIDQELEGLLLQYRWWDLPIEQIRLILNVLCSGRLDEVKDFLRRELIRRPVDEQTQLWQAKPNTSVFAH